MITKKEEWSHLPDYLFFEKGDYIIWNGKPGKIIEVNGVRFDSIVGHLATSGPTLDYFGYGVELYRGALATISDYCYTFKLDKSKYRNDKIEELLK